jgi:hypothetical protein
MKTARRLSIGILLLTSLFSLYGGTELVNDPTGSSLKFPFRLLSHTIFPDYSMIGWTLIVTVGLFSLTIIICILIKTICYSFQIMVQGVIICAYVFLMLLLLQQAFMLECMFLIFGLGLIFLGAHQYQRKIVVDTRKKIGGES